MKLVVSMGIMEKVLRIARVCKSVDTLHMFIKEDGTAYLCCDGNYVIFQDRVKNEGRNTLAIDVKSLVKSWKIKKPDSMEIGENDGCLTLRIGSVASDNAGCWVFYRDEADLPDYSGLEFTPYIISVLDKDFFTYLKHASLYCDKKNDYTPSLQGVCIDKKERTVVAMDGIRMVWKRFDDMELDTFDTENTDRQVIGNTTWKIADAIDCTMLATGENANICGNDNGDIVLVANDRLSFPDWKRFITVADKPWVEFSARKLFDIIEKHRGEAKKNSRNIFIISDRITLETEGYNIDCGPLPDAAGTRMRIDANFLFDASLICKKTDGKCRIVAKKGYHELRLTLDNGEKHLICGLRDY